MGARRAKRKKQRRPDKVSDICDVGERKMLCERSEMRAGLLVATGRLRGPVKSCENRVISVTSDFYFPLWSLSNV